MRTSFRPGVSYLALHSREAPAVARPWLLDAIRATSRHLYVGLHFDVESLSSTDFNSLVSDYYTELSKLSAFAKTPLFQSTLIFNGFLGHPSFSFSSFAQAVPDLDALLVVPQAHLETSFKELLSEANQARKEAKLPLVQQFMLSSLLPKLDVSGTTTSPKRQRTNRPVYDQVVLGGTFDYLHNGHKVLLSVAAMSCKQTLTIGLSGPIMLAKKKNASVIQPYEDRKDAVIQFLNLCNPQIKVDIFELHDVYGPALNEGMEALALSKETLSGLEVVNDKRKECNLPPLEPIVVDLAFSTESSSPESNEIEGKLSSTMLRALKTEELKNRQEWVQRKWIALSSAIGADPSVTAKWWDIIVTRYGESQRAYHTLEHVAALLELLDTSTNDYQVSRPMVVSLAIFFHDIIYDPKKKDNEDLSADTFTKFASETKLDANDAKLVHSYIMATKAHSVESNPHDRDLAVFLDMDLSILGASPLRYQQYAREIRFEYQHYPATDYCNGRIAVLKHLASESKSLFVSPYYRDQLELRARFNVAAEVEKLTAIQKGTAKL